MNLKQIIQELQSGKQLPERYTDIIEVYAVACAHQLGLGPKSLEYFKIAISTYLNPNDFAIPLPDSRMAESLLAAVMFVCNRELNHQILDPNTVVAFEKIEPLIQPL